MIPNSTNIFYQYSYRLIVAKFIYHYPCETKTFCLCIAEQNDKNKNLQQRETCWGMMMGFSKLIGIHLLDMKPIVKNLMDNHNQQMF